MISEPGQNPGLLTPDQWACGSFPGFDATLSWNQLFLRIWFLPVLPVLVQAAQKKTTSAVLDASSCSDVSPPAGSGHAGPLARTENGPAPVRGFGSDNRAHMKAGRKADWPPACGGVMKPTPPHD